MDVSGLNMSWSEPKRVWTKPRGHFARWTFTSCTVERAVLRNLPRRRRSLWTEPASRRATSCRCCPWSCPGIAIMRKSVKVLFFSTFSDLLLDLKFNHAKVISNEKSGPGE